jgi:hypothetical protein
MAAERLEGGLEGGLGMRRSLATSVLLCASLAAFTVGTAGAAGAATSARLAPAGTTVTAKYPLTGSTFISKVSSTTTLGPGTLVSKIDLKKSTLKATFKLPPATSAFSVLGVIPVTTTTEFIQAGTAPGKLSKKGVVTTTAQITLKLTSLSVAGLPLPLGPHCQTVTPATLPVTSTSGFNVLKGGNLTGTYTIPDFGHCGLATSVINLTIPGPGNTITLTLGKPKLG